MATVTRGSVLDWRERAAVDTTLSAIKLCRPRDEEGHERAIVDEDHDAHGLSRSWLNACYGGQRNFRVRPHEGVEVIFIVQYGINFQYKELLAPVTHNELFFTIIIA